MKKVLSLLIITLLSVFFIVPIILTVVSSMMGTTELSSIYSSNDIMLRIIPMKVSFDHYFRLLISNSDYLQMFWNSVFIAVGIAVGTVIVATFVGFAFAKAPSRRSGITNFLYIIVMLMPFQVTLLPNYIVIKSLGLYNSVWALIIPSIFAPFGVFLLSRFFKSIDDEIINAAMLETNSYITILFKIVVPIASPGLSALFLLSFADGWNMVEQPLILLSEKSLYPLSIALNDAIIKDLGLAFAGAVLYALPMMFLYKIFEEELIESLSAVKF